MPSWRTPPQIAAELAIDVSKVLAWIHSGQLVAVNVAENATGRARWRIAQAEFEAFLNRRQRRPQVAVKRRKKQVGVIEFY